MNDVSEHLISYELSLNYALEKLNTLSNELTLFALDENEKVIGSLTDGDIRRALLSGLTLSSSIKEAMQLNFKFLKLSDIDIDVVQNYKNLGINLLPLVDNDMRLIKILNLNVYHSILPLDVVIMAGGEGVRLRPLTENVPKPLLLVGDKPILEHNIDRLVNFGINNINICVKYLGHKIVDYFSNQSIKQIDIKYFFEESQLGTAGALSMISDFHFEDVLLMNADLLTNIDFEDFFRRFKASGADFMVAGIPYTVNVPYAILETNSDHDILSLSEKPSFTYYSNAGIYLFKRSCIELIPPNEYFNATDLIEKLISLGGTVKYYPLLQFWLDIGSKEDYEKANEFIKHLKI
jgi:dTDP-glucose pyrophosphorylase